jgi:hypothetical protein
MEVLKGKPMKTLDELITKVDALLEAKEDTNRFRKVVLDRLEQLGLSLAAINGNLITLDGLVKGTTDGFIVAITDLRKDLQAFSRPARGRGNRGDRTGKTRRTERGRTKSS